MSLLKLAALGAEVLDILQRNVEWNSDTLDMIQTRASLLGLTVSDDEEMFDICPNYKNTAFTLFADYESAVENSQSLSLEIDTHGDRVAMIYPGGSIGERSGVKIRIGKREYEL
jgi:hypothetical protein